MKKIILKVWFDQVIHFWLYPYMVKPLNKRMMYLRYNSNGLYFTYIKGLVKIYNYAIIMPENPGL